MEIIRKGDINEAKRKIKMTKRFECSVCGCIFKADLGEYKCESQYNSTYYSIKCPCCKQSVYADK